jgi:ParB family chromosome partitioning protein
MTKAAPKLTLAPPQTIPLDKLALHDGNVRQIKAGVSIESLAADIGRRGLLQSLSVRPILNEAGEETGSYGVQAGGRRLRALQLLVKQKRLAKNAPVPCIVRSEGFVEADSLAENTEREALHPLDQFRAFKALADKGEGEETIAAAFGVSAHVVKQRLRLAKASPVLLQAYEDEELTLDQLMAFCLTDDHERQEQVFDAIQKQWNKGADAIRRMLTEKTVHAGDRRALFVGADAYKAAGGIIIRDLFDEDDGGYLQDVPLLECLVSEKLAAEAETVKAEGWGWIEAAVDFPWNHHQDFRTLKPISPALTEEQERQLQALLDELEALDETGDRSEQEETRRDLVVRAIADLENRSPVFDDAQKARAGAFVSLRDDGLLGIERGYVRREDAGDHIRDHVHFVTVTGDEDDETLPANFNGASSVSQAAEDEEDDANGLPDRLMIELTAYHSLALRDALANNPGTAFLAMLHAMTLRLFYHYTTDTCLQVEAKDGLTSPFPGLADFPASGAIAARHRAWEEALPEKPEDLWAALQSLDAGNREALFAHCAGLTINAVYEPHTRVSQKRRHAFQLAEALRLDMTQAGWVTRADNYLNRVTKSMIVATVSEAKGEATAELLADLKKKDMAIEAERLLTDTGWLPEPLRMPAPLDEAPAETLPAFLDEEEALQAAE